MNYSIHLDEKKIGITELEKADAAMGVVFGEISFIDDSFDYSYFSNYCKRNSIKVDEYAEDKFISTQNISRLKVYNDSEIEIKGIGAYVAGMDSKGFEVNILGIPYPFYEKEFPKHIKEYNEICFV